MNVKTFVVVVEDYETALAELDDKVNQLLGTYEDRHIVIEGENAIQDTFYPPLKKGDFPKLARRIVYKTIWRS